MGKATIVRVDGSTEELDHKPSLEEAQKVVDGYIELIKAQDIWKNKVRLVVNEEGKIINLPTNKSVTMIYGPSVYGGYIVGDVIILEGWRTVG